MKKVFIISAMAIIIQFFNPVPQAQASILEFFFPSLRVEEADPTDTLQAPFADVEALKEKGDAVKIGTLPENNVPLEQAHRGKLSISKWVSNTVSEVTAFTASDIQADIDSHKIYFDGNGQREYMAFLEQQGVMASLKTQQYFIRSFVEDTPMLLNEGTVNGRYRWLYEVPVMTSTMDRGMSDYKKASAVNKKVVITLQIGRTNDAENDTGVLIETWSARAAK